ncbi:PREDICTED: uncharacterized protein LOC108563684 [Nicrophorus vespilloides]|uniref:Uncharacterized protein LOC108563684 n=1 Tax=Nicrophorus vespilloides TaxID=110193 RepID=A0ABM1MTL8_NICVS|nr:PREDICTED: uncharacterized protein LOC108563684 [Nicrophorus vespilloides]
MVKFKLFKKGLEGVKCLVKKAFITKPTHSMPRINVCNKESRNSAKSTTVASVSSAEGFIPLAARDSQWVGIEFYNPNFRSPLDEDDDAEEYELQNLAAEGMDAIFHLFPGLNKHDSLLKEHDSSSTTAITKLLVGQKADFRNMKSSRKLLPTDVSDGR